jgi:hypothetical protein
VVPLTIPLLTGPATISTMVIYAERTRHWWQLVTLVLYAPRGDGGTVSPDASEPGWNPAAESRRIAPWNGEDTMSVRVVWPAPALVTCVAALSVSPFLGVQRLRVDAISASASARASSVCGRAGGGGGRRFGHRTEAWDGVGAGIGTVPSGRAGDVRLWPPTEPLTAPPTPGRCRFTLPPPTAPPTAP